MRLDLSAREEKQRTKEDKSLDVFVYGVARNRLLQAAKQLKATINIVDELEDANVFLTLKSYYRKQRRLIKYAEQNRIPVYVMRANTVAQMESFLAQMLDLEVVSPDPFEAAVAEADRAILMIQAGQSSVDLKPVNSAVRRYQHQMARQANLVSHSYGKEPHRHVRIFSEHRN
ncbi:MAG: R3H domain-containing nucleic acid-binding protein [Chloroflexota bacterium]